MAAEIGWERWPGFASHVRQQLDEHPWPGNVRELINAAERHALRLTPPAAAQAASAPGSSLAEQMEAFEAQCLHNALQQHKGNISEVMNQLQLPRRTLNEKMQRHGLSRSDYLPAGSADN